MCVCFFKWLNIIPLYLHLFIHNFTCMQSVEHIPHESVEQGGACHWVGECVWVRCTECWCYWRWGLLSSSGVDLMLSSKWLVGSMLLWHVSGSGSLSLPLSCTFISVPLDGAGKKWVLFAVYYPAGEAEYSLACTQTFRGGRNCWREILSYTTLGEGVMWSFYFYI